MASSSDSSTVSSDENGVVIDVRDGVEPSVTTTGTSQSSTLNESNQSGQSSDVVDSGCGLLDTPEGDTTSPSSGVNGHADQTWSISQLATEFGVTHRTLRYYESLGLVTPQRVGSRRVFGHKDRVRLGLVLRGKRLGFGLDEISEIMNMYSAGAGAVGQLEYVLSRLGDRRADLERRLTETQEALAELDSLQRGCAAKLEQAKAAATS